MTFAKYAALMLLGFTLFVGYTAYTKQTTKQEQCDARFHDYIANINNVNDKYATLVALCPAELTRENNLIIVKAFEAQAQQ